MPVVGGEVVCPVRGDGQGGRNQEFAMRAAIHLSQRGLDDVVVLSAGTDGIDGNSQAAGAIADSYTLRRAKRKAFRRSEACRTAIRTISSTLSATAIITGRPATNVRDIRILTAQ